jgi:hypothetical protein
VETSVPINSSIKHITSIDKLSRKITLEELSGVLCMSQFRQRV